MTHFSPKQAAQALGVSESSVKRWCDLGAVPALRTAGGHRRIPRKQIEEILAKGGDLSSLPPLSEEIPQSVTPAECAKVYGTATGENSLEAIQEEFRNALDAGLESRCRQLLFRLVANGLSRSQAADKLITDSMHHIGHRWAQGEMAVYQERRACGICQSLLFELKQTIAVAGNSPIAVGCAPEGDSYQLPTQLVELVLRESGWQATSLGANVPIESIRKAVDEYRPHLLWVSVSHVECEESFVREFNALANSIPQGTAIILGGRAANDTLRPKLRYTAHCDSLTHLSDLAAAFLSKSP